MHSLVGLVEGLYFRPPRIVDDVNVPECSSVGCLELVSCSQLHQPHVVIVLVYYAVLIILDKLDLKG